MHRMKFATTFHRPIGLALMLALLPAAWSSVQAGSSDDDAAVVEQSKTSTALEALPRRPFNQRAVVAINQLRSNAPDVPALSATDMFTTALIESGQFRVMEQPQDAQSGTPAPAQGPTAQLIFEGTVSEMNAGETQKQSDVNVGGMDVGGDKQKDAMAIDVRVLDAATGEVVESVTVRKIMKSSSTTLSGTASLANSVASYLGRAISAPTPDVNYQKAHKANVDGALRACIETAVLELVKRLQADFGTTAK